MSELRGFKNSTSVEQDSSGFVEGRLEACLTENKVGCSIVSYSSQVDSGGGDCIGCFEIKIWADTAKLTRIVGFDKRN